MKHLVIVGGGAALAQPLIERHLSLGWRVTAICRSTRPDLPEGDRLAVVEDGGTVKVPIDAVVTLTGTVDNAKLVGMSKRRWDSVVDSCLTAPACALNQLLPSVVDGGSVCVVGSVVGSTGGYGCANYAAAKAGLVGLVRAAANEHAARGVRVNLLELGYVAAGMGARLDPKVQEKVRAAIPLGRFGTTGEFVRAVEFLLDAPYMTGGTLTLSGGLR